MYNILSKTDLIMMHNKLKKKKHLLTCPLLSPYIINDNQLGPMSLCVVSLSFSSTGQDM